VSASALPLSIDGVIVAARAAQISALDTTLTQGLGAFDTLLVEDRVARLRERHLDRLRKTCTFLGLASPRIERIDGWLDSYVAALPSEPLAVRTTVTRGAPGLAGRILIAARRFDPAPVAGVTLSIEQRFVLAGDELDRHKTTSRGRYALARESAVHGGAFDALVCHREGDVADATSANVWARIGAEIVTPPIERGALPGVVRAVLMEELARTGPVVRERPLEPADLALAEEVFLTSSLHRVVGVRAIVGLVDGLPGSGGSTVQRVFDLVLAAEQRYG
jgi:branched-chain amino acid aminotransferase